MAKILKCQACGNLILELVKDKCDVFCCGKPMKEVVPNTSEGAGEKHIPVVSLTGNEVHVNVGEVDHPMLPEHYIVFIAIETDQGVNVKWLHPGDKPAADFVLAEGERFIRALEYCSIHGLWASK